jgi:hypothetical protein
MNSSHLSVVFPHALSSPYYLYEHLKLLSPFTIALTEIYLPIDRPSASFTSVGLIQANIIVKILSQRNSHTFLFLSATLPKEVLDLKAASTAPVAQHTLLVL